ncbi:hypothetical protein GCM10027168_00540 [Streptomyces capparidis]
MTGAPLTPDAARRRFTAVTFLFWLPVGLYIPANVLLLTERGMSPAAVSALFAVYSCTVAALELPTGGLSDVIGRRVVLAAAGLLTAGGLALLALGTSLAPLVAAKLLLACGRALSSGPAEAWYVDTVHAHSGPGAELRRGLARSGTASAAALALGTLAGGGLPWLLGLGADPGARLAAATSGLVLPLSLPVLLGAAVAAAYTGYVLTALPEPPRPPATLRGVLRGVPGTVRDGLRLGGTDTLVRRLLLTAGAMGAALATVELLSPMRAADVTGGTDSGALLYASLACAGFACTAAGSHGAPWLARAARGGERAVLVSLAVAGAGLVLLAVTAPWAGPAALALAAAGYALVYVGLGAASPNGNDLLHHRVPGAVRATALSVQSLCLQAAGALAGLGAGALAGGAPAWLPATAVLLAGAALWVRRAPAAPVPAGLAATAPSPPPRPAESGAAGGDTVRPTT